jgi:hypothetical protein
MPQLSLEFQALYMAVAMLIAFHSQGRTCAVYGQCISLTGTVRGTARRPHLSLVFISVTVELWI